LDEREQKSRVALLSVVSNSILVVGKVVIGVAIGSVSVISRPSTPPSTSSRRHRPVRRAAIGSPRTATIRSATARSRTSRARSRPFLILVAAVLIVREARHKLISPGHGRPALGVVIMLGVVPMNIYVSRRLFKVTRDTGSVALEPTRGTC